MRILGLDPGLARTGYAILETGQQQKLCTYGCIETPKEFAAAERLVVLEQQVQHLIRSFHPTEAAIEKLFFQKNVSTALSVGQARGVLLLTLGQFGLPYQEFTPQQIKIAVAGHGKAEKRQVQRMVQVLLHLDRLPTPDDAADAIAIAVTAAAIRPSLRPPHATR